MNEEIKSVGKVVYPDYWKKRKHRLKPDFVKMLEDTAKAEPVATDKYGEYKPGTFLHKSYIVTVTKDEVWGVHIFGEHPVTPQVIKEVRYKYMPDSVIMAQLYGSRADESELKGVVLYEIPSQVEDVADVVE